MKITIKYDVPESVREALKRHNESATLPTKAEVQAWFMGVCQAATFSIVDHDDLVKANRKRAKKKSADK